jgi:hypothetical protein
MSSEAQTFQRGARGSRAAFYYGDQDSASPSWLVCGIAVMAIVEIIEWPLAIVMMVGDEVAHRTHKQALRDFAEGIAGSECGKAGADVFAIDREKFS